MREGRLTMIELLVLLFVIGLAMALVMPVFHCGCGSREPARRANCAGNLKQMGVAMLMYSGDFNGHFPPTPNGNSLEPLNTTGYLHDSKVYQCPSSTSGRTLARDADYWYEGSGLMDDDERAPTRRLVYDMYGNHNKEWMNVLFVDGHVSGGKPGNMRPYLNDHAVITPPETSDQ